MKSVKPICYRRAKENRNGIATVEFAICAPILLLIGFGFINCGLLVQTRHQAKLVGHLAATDVFQQPFRNVQTVAALELRYEKLAEDLGIKGLDVQIAEGANEIVVVTTTMSVSDNSIVPVKFQTAGTITTETYVYAPFEPEQNNEL